MKLIVFLKNKKELVINDGKHFLQQRYQGSKEIVLTKRKRKNKALARKDIEDFIQARYYSLFKSMTAGVNMAY